MASIQVRKFMLRVTATAFAIACGSSPSPSGPNVQPLTSTEYVTGRGVDKLDPLPPGTVVSLSIDQVLTVLRASPQTAPYVANTEQLSVTVGLYTNASLERPGLGAVRNLPSYVIRGGHAVCAPLGGGPTLGASGPRTAPQTNTCTSTFVVDARSGDVIVFREDGDG